MSKTVGAATIVLGHNTKHIRTSDARQARASATLMLVLAIETGMTGSEIAGLAWADGTGLRFRGGGS
jgi:integrase